MTAQEIMMKLQQCRNDIKGTNSTYRKNDLRKYEKKLLHKLNQIRRNTVL